MSEHAESEEQSERLFYFNLGRLFTDLSERLGRIERNQVTKELFMAAIDALRSAQADKTQAITDLGTTITNEADQITAVLNQLVAAEGNQVTDADVQAAVDAAARIRAAGVAVAGLVPDAAPAPDPGAPA